MWAEDIIAINGRIKEKFPDKTIWLYSGRTLEYLKEHELSHKLINTVDVLVDGPFVEELKTTKVPFRGSTNQRILRRKGYDQFEEADDKEFQ